MLVYMSDHGIRASWLADGLNEAGVPTARGGSRWNASTIRSAVKRERARRERLDHEARESEHRVGELGC